MSANPVSFPVPMDESQHALAESCWERAFRFAALVTRNDQEAEDVAQEAMARALRHLHRYDSRHGPFEAWLWRIVVNVARDAGRAATRRSALWERLQRLRSAPPVDVEDIVLRRLDDTALVAAVRRLPRRPRTVIALRFGAQLSYREIGEQLGVSEAAALMATRRALDALRRDLQSKETSR